jgi:RNA polymerase sigma-70 factor (ECF subfamily)
LDADEIMLTYSKLVILITLNTNETDPFRQQLIDLLPRLRRFAYTLTSNQFDADDLVQAACERALSRRKQFTVGTRLDSWMFRIIHTLRIDATRSARFRNPHLSFNEKYDGKGVTAHDDSKMVEAKILLDNVHRAMGQLPENDRTILALVCVDGMSYKEAAETLDIPVGTVMSRLARARIKLTKLVYGKETMRTDRKSGENHG